MCSMMLTITVILLPILMFLTVKITRLVWKNDKTVPLMLIMLCVTLITLILYYSSLIKSKLSPAWCCTEDTSCVCLSSMSSEMPAWCLAIAIILNLNKWIYFKLRINAFVQVGFGFNEAEEIVDTESDAS